MKKWLINLEKTILWQYDKATRLTRVVLSKENWYKQNVTNFIVGFLIDIFNLKTANDFGLSVWGKILNFPRQVTNKNNNSIINLTTEQYRFLLLGQILKFKMSCTIPEINRYLRIIFNEQDNKNVYVTDNHNMTITYTLNPQVLSEEISDLIENYDFLPRPAGVKVITGIGDFFTFKIVPSPSNAEVRLRVNGEIYNTTEIRVSSGQDVYYEVSDIANGFTTQTGTVTVTEDTEIPVVLETTLTITATPNTANISLTIDGNTYTATGTITKTVTYGNIYSWQVSNSGYYTETSGGNLTVTGLTNTQVTLSEANINLIFDKLFKTDGGVESKGTFIVQRAGSYHIELGGDGGLDENYPNTRTNGGTAEITTTFAVDDVLEIKIMYGGYDSGAGNIYGGVGVGLWVNGVCKLVAGGGGQVATLQVVSYGGGGYNGGYAYYRNRYAVNGYSIDGTRGNYQNTEDGAGQHRHSTYGDGYGGSGYKSSDYNSAVLVYAGNTGAGYARISYIQ